MTANDREPEARIPLETAANAANVPASTARYWLREHKPQATKQGYPLAVLIDVFAANGRPVSPHTLLAAASTRRLRGPSRRHFAGQEGPRTESAALAPAPAFAALVGRLEAANGAILAELRAIRAAIDAANDRELARVAAAQAARDAAEQEIARLSAEVAALRARRRPWWRRLLGGE